MKRVAEFALAGIFFVAIGLSLSGFAHAAAASTPTPSSAQLTQTAQAAEIKAIEEALAPATATPTPSPAAAQTITPTATIQAKAPDHALTLIPVIESPHPYPNNYDESWLISNMDAKAQATRLHFGRLELEEGVDWLIIMDPQDVELQRITGFYPDGVWTDPIPGNLVRIRLVTDGSVQHWGFAVDGLESMPYTTLAYSPHPYPHYANLKWQFNNLDAKAAGTSLHFSRIDLEEGVDWLVIMDLTETPYQWITGHYTRGLQTIGVPGTGVVVKLVSDGSVNDWGFNLDVLKSVSPDKAQPRPEPEEFLAESKHPYEPNTGEVWILVNPNPAAAFSKVHFTRLDVGGEGDSLILYDGNGNRIQIFGENTHLRDRWSDDIPGRIVKVQLNSGRYYEDWGFQIDRLVDGETRVAPAESPHPYHPNWSNTWTLVNPNPAAAFSKVHFTRLDVGGEGDSLILYDGNGNRIQIFGENTHLRDRWSDDIPGRIVKVQLNSGRYYEDWGFRIDDIAPKVDETPIPASVSAVYVYVGQPGTLWLNSVELGKASVPGEYLIRLPELGENLIAVETLFHKQEIVVRTDKDGGVKVEYSGIQPKSEENSK